MTASYRLATQVVTEARAAACLSALLGLGYRAMAILGADEDGSLPFWHHPGDTVAVVTKEALGAGRAAAAALLRQLDRLLGSGGNAP